MRKTVVIGAVLIVAAALAGGYWWYQKQAPGGEAAAPEGMPAGGFATPVEAVEVEVDRVELKVPAIGSLLSYESVILSPEIAGRLDAFLVEEGKPVAKGTPIARLDQSVYRAELARATASLELSKANVERFQQMQQRDVASVQAVQQAEAALKANVAEIALAQAQLAKTEIAAPFDGILGLRQVSVGDYLDAGAPIINLEQVHPLKVDFRIPETYFSIAKVGQTLAISVDALPGEKFEGKIYAIDPLIDREGRSILLRATIPNEDDRLRPGLFVSIELIYDAREQAILVPEQAIVPIGTGKFVFKVVDGKAVQTPVELGIRDAGRVEVTKGLAAGDTVVTAGQLKLMDGAAVAPQPPAGT
jgi:membrane fusion protein (multidrug efflux system)